MINSGCFDLRHELRVAVLSGLLGSLKKDRCSSSHSTMGQHSNGIVLQSIAFVPMILSAFFGYYLAPVVYESFIQPRQE